MKIISQRYTVNESNFHNVDYLRNLNLLEILILLLVPALIIGPAVAEIILLCSIIIFVFFINRDTKENKFLLDNKFIYFFVFFYFFFFINTLISNTPIIVSLKILFFVRFIFLLLIINFILNKNKNFLINLSKVTLITFIILFLDALFQKLMGYNLLGQQVINNFRISSFFGEELVMGGYIARFAPILLFGFFLFKNHKIQLLFFFTYIVSYYFVLISGERAAAVTSVIGFLYLVIFLDIKKSHLIKFIITIITMLIIFIYTDNNIKIRMIDHYKIQISQKYLFAEIEKLKKLESEKISSLVKEKEKISLNPKLSSKQKVQKKMELENAIKEIEKKMFKINSLNENKYIKLIPNQLILLNKTSINMFTQNKLLGQGPYSFKYYCNDKVQNIKCSGGHPHNSYLQLLLETGTIGFLYFLIPLIFLIFFQFKLRLKKKKNTLNYNQFTIASCLVFIILWPINQNGNIFNNWLNIAYYLSFSIYIYFLKKKI